MEIGLLTFQRASSYGAVLQAYALETYLDNLDDCLNVEVIDYRNEAIEFATSNKRLLTNNKPTSYIKYILLSNGIKRRNEVFSCFRQTNLKMSQSCNKSNFASIVAKYDLIIVGSDQVWNDEITNNDTTYFLSEINDDFKKGTYAVSLGMDKYDDLFFRKHKNHIRSFSYLSLRESKSVSFIKKAYGRDSLLCIDPVFLMGRDKWTEFASKEKVEEKYIFCFVLRSDNHEERTINIARQISKRTGYKIKLLLNSNRFYKFINIKHINNPSPEEFVRLIRDAQVVVTNSFHATAFSIIMHTVFYVDLGSRKTERIVNLLKTFHLEERGCADGILPNVNNDIDWNEVDNIIAGENEISRTYISSMIDQGTKV